MAKERSSNFELLRIVGMVMIVFHHFAVHSGLYYDDLGINSLYIATLSVIGKVGVYIFVLISGYFLIDSSGIRLPKLIKLWLQIFFYSVVCFSIALATGRESLSTLTKLSDALLPISTDSWWFASAYFIMYLFSPFINRALRTMTQRQYLRTILVAVFVWFVVETVTTGYIQGNALIRFFVLYSIGGYIKIYKKDREYSRKKLAAVAVLLTAVSVSLRLLFTYLAEEKIFSDFTQEYRLSFSNEQSLLTVCIAVPIFLIFKSTKIKTSKIINVISSASFGVYLIHDNSYVRPFLWKTLVKGDSFKESPYLIPYSVAVCVAIYIVCSLIELARIYLLEKNYMKLIYKAEPKLNRVLHKAVDSVCQKIR